MGMKILIMGLPTSGKTTLATELAKWLGAVHFNADDIRQNINKELGFTQGDRKEQARRMGHLCDIVKRSGNIAIADFVCPTESTRYAFGRPDLTIFMDTVEASPYEDTNRIFVPPLNADLRFTTWSILNTVQCIEAVRHLQRVGVFKRREANEIEITIPKPPEGYRFDGNRHPRVGDMGLGKGLKWKLIEHIPEGYTGEIFCASPIG